MPIITNLYIIHICVYMHIERNENFSPVLAMVAPKGHILSNKNSNIRHKKPLYDLLSDESKGLLKHYKLLLLPLFVFYRFMVYPYY